MTRIYKFKMALLTSFDPCKSVLSVLSVVRFWIFVQSSFSLQHKCLKNLFWLCCLRVSSHRAPTSANGSS
jgi:hypothetical protein